MTAVVVALTLIVGILAVLVLGLLRSHADILRALHALGVDLDPSREGELGARTSVPAPTPGRVGAGMAVPVAITGHDPTGGSISVALLGGERRTLLAFLSSGCLTCRPMWEALGDAHVEVPGGARVVVVTKGPHEESPSSIQALVTPHLTTVMSSEAWEAFAVPGSPYFVLVDGSGSVLGEGTAAAWSRVVELLTEALGDAPPVVGGASPARGGSRARHAHIDETLRAAGIESGDPSLYPGQTAGEG